MHTSPSHVTFRPRRARLLAAATSVLVASALLASCGGSSPSGHATTTTTPSTRTSGCGSSSTPGSGVYQFTIDRYQRSVVVHVPSGYDDASKIALVLNLHGSGATGVDQDAFSAMDGTADAHGFLVAYPQGRIPDGSGFDWNVPGEPLLGGRAVPAGSANDVAFLTALVGVLERQYCVDAHRVYATGFSGGARMASQLACDASGVFAAVATVSGLRHPTACPASRAVPILAFHGTADPVDPFGGNGEAYWTYSVPNAAAQWARQDRCAPSPATTHPSSQVTLTTYSRCASGAQVELYAIAGEGHEWPGGPKVPSVLRALLGPQSDAVDANAVMWSFFAAHTLG